MVKLDRLQRAKFGPLFVEDAVRTVLRDAVAWRIGGGAAPGAEAFTAAAVASARLALDGMEVDVAERSRMLAAVARAARRFTTSALSRRLMRVPAGRFLRLPYTPHGADVIVRDRRRRLHAIALTMRADALDAGQLATRIATRTPLAIRDRLTPLHVHIFSLASARLYMLEREVDARLPHARHGRVA